MGAYRKVEPNGYGGWESIDNILVFRPLLPWYQCIACPSLFTTLHHLHHYVHECFAFRVFCVFLSGVIDWCRYYAGACYAGASGENAIRAWYAPRKFNSTHEKNNLAEIQFAITLAHALGG